MRRSFKGAAAVAALCAGALTMTSLAVAENYGAGWLGSGSDAKDVRLAGVDRVQTALEALAKHTNTVNIMIVGYQGVVDALSLPPVVNQYGDSAIVYASTHGLDSRVVSVLKQMQANNRIGKVFISGGYGAVPMKAFSQLRKIGVPESNITRISGMDRYETAYLTSALALGGAPVENALQRVNYFDRLKAEFASIKAAYDKAVAEESAANMAFAKASAELAAASKAFATEAAKVADVKDQKHLNDFSSASSANAAKQKTYSDLVGLRPAMARVLKAAKVWKPVTWKNTPLGVIKGGVPSVAKDINDIEAVDKAITDATFAGEAEGDLNDHIAAADKARQKANDDLAKYSAAFLKATQNIKQLGDPNSAVSKARVRYMEAKVAEEKANKRLKKASGERKKAEAKYRNAAAQLLGGIDEKNAHKALDKAVNAAFSGHRFDIFLATGRNFADALSAGPAAKAANGVVLLSNGMKLTPQVAAVVNTTQHDVFGIGGAAAKAFKDALPVYGADRYETSVKVALRFFNDKGQGVYALASGETGADAVTAGVFMSTMDSSLAPRGILLTRKNVLMSSVADYIQYGNHADKQYPVSRFIVFGGNGVVSPDVVAKAEALSHN